MDTIAHANVDFASHEDANGSVADTIAYSQGNLAVFDAQTRLDEFAFPFDYPVGLASSSGGGVTHGGNTRVVSPSGDDCRSFVDARLPQSDRIVTNVVWRFRHEGHDLSDQSRPVLLEVCAGS